MRECSAHKCALGSENMVDALVNFFNVKIKSNHCPKTWLKVADMMIEKRKVQRIKQLRTLEIIESDMQLIMKIFLGNRMSSKVEEDKILSECDCDSFKGCSVET